MQRGRFEFDAPRHCNFFLKRAMKQPEEYQLDTLSINDNWLTKMVHEGQLRPVQDADERPIVRQQRKTERAPAPVKKEWWEDEGSKDKQSQSNEQPQLQKVREINGGKKRMTRPKPQPVNRHRNPQAHKPEARALKSKVERPQKAQRSLSVEKFPCPFGPRTQRRWQQENKKSWYDLSREERTEAIRQMKLLEDREAHQKEVRQAGPIDKKRKLKTEGSKVEVGHGGSKRE